MKTSMIVVFSILSFSAYSQGYQVNGYSQGYSSNQQGYVQEQFPDTPNQGWNGWQPVYDQEYQNGSKMRCHVEMSSIRPYVSSFNASVNRNQYSRNNGPMHVQSVTRACGFNKEQFNQQHGPFHGFEETIAFTCYPQKALVSLRSHLYFRGEPVPSSVIINISSNNNYHELPWEVPTNYLDKNTLDYVCSFIRQ